MTIPGVSQITANTGYKNSLPQNTNSDDKFNKIVEKVEKNQSLDMREMQELRMGLSNIKDNSVLEKLAPKLINYPQMVDRIVSTMRQNTLDSNNNSAGVSSSVGSTQNDIVSSKSNISIAVNDPVQPGLKFTVEANRVIEKFKQLNNSNNISSTGSVEGNSSEYNSAAIKLNISIEAFKNELGNIKDPEKYQDAVKVLADLSTQYQGIVAKGDKVEIAIFSTFMNKVTKGLDDINNGNDVNISDIMQQNNDMMTRVFSNHPPHDSEIESFLGLEATDQIRSALCLKRGESLIKSVNEINIPDSNPNAAKLNATKERVNESVNTIMGNLNSMTPAQSVRLMFPLSNIVSRYKESMKDPAQAAYYACMLNKLAQASEEIKNGQTVDLEDLVEKSNEIISALDSKKAPSVDDIKGFLGNENFNFLSNIINGNAIPQNNTASGANSSSGNSTAKGEELIPVSSVDKATASDLNVVKALSASRGHSGHSLVIVNVDDKAGIATSMSSYFKELGAVTNFGKSEQTGDLVHIKPSKSGIPSSLLIKPELIQTAKKVSPTNIRSLFRENPKLTNALKNFKSSMVDFKKAFKNEVLNKTHALKVPRNKTKELLNVLSEMKKNIFNKDTTVSEKIATQLEKSIQELQASIGKLMDKLDLNIDPAPASIVPLLAEFRKIITNLDIDTRNLIKSSLEKQILSNRFQSNKKEAKDSESNLDKLKLMILLGLSKAVN